ncbi:MAG: septum formation initiator family protein [Solirubrobacteraceae bacterium]
MAAARSTNRRAPAARPRPKPTARPRVLAGGARGIRWDRISRVALLAVLIGIVGLYIGPARSYWSTRQEVAHRSAEVAQLQRENKRLRARRDALRNAGALERDARRLGMLRPGERSYVLKHLPKGP